MKTLLVLAILSIIYIGFVGSATKDENDLLFPLNNECFTILGYDKSIIQVDDDNFMIENEPKLNNYFECSWKKDGLITNEGVVNVFKMQRLMNQKLIKVDSYIRDYLILTAMKKCKDVEGKDIGHSCVKMYNCLYGSLIETYSKLQEAKEEV